MPHSAIIELQLGKKNNGNVKIDKSYQLFPYQVSIIAQNLKGRFHRPKVAIFLCVCSYKRL